MSVSKKPMVLVILDGYGYREEQQDNAIFSAKTPVMDAPVSYTHLDVYKRQGITALPDAVPQTLAASARIPFW